MKKFGTPIGAGPGSESEKVGLDAVGTPLPVGSVTFGVALALAFALALRCPLPWGVVVVCGRVEGFCFLVGRLGAGPGLVLEDDEVVVELEVELELELEDEDDELEPELLELDPVPLGPEDDEVVVLDELELAGTQVSVSEAIPPVTGRLRLEIGVPGATSGTVKVWGCPTTGVIVTVQVSADAAEVPRPARATRRLPASASTTSSFRLLTVSDSS
ncbi:MAG: hypothetical protein NVS3B18_14460 [Candidatus Dormibacteria bacterium]